MRTRRFSLTTTGAIAALALAAAACGGSESAEPSGTATAESVAPAPPDTDPVVDSIDVAEPDLEDVSNDAAALGTDSTVDTTAAPATDVVTTEPTDAGECFEPESTGLAFDIGVVAQFDNESGQNPEGLAFDAAGNAYVSFAPARPGRAARRRRSRRRDRRCDSGVGRSVPRHGWHSVRCDRQPVRSRRGWRELRCVGLRVRHGEPTRIAGTDAIGLPNALAFDDAGNLFVTDSNSASAEDQTALGAVWRISPTGEVVRWVEDIVLGGTDEIGIGPVGANGLAIGGDRIYVAVTEKASIVEIPVLDDGAPGPALGASRPAKRSRSSKVWRSRRTAPCSRSKPSPTRSSQSAPMAPSHRSPSGSTATSTSRPTSSSASGSTQRHGST